VKILLTGGAGFVGSRLARALLARGTLEGRSIERLVLADQSAPAADLTTDPRVQAAVGPLLAQCDEAYEASRAELGGRSALNLPALSLRVGDLLDALERVAGKAVRARVRLEPDARIESIVASWPARFRSERAARLGLDADPSFERIIEAYIADHPDAVARG
jgi:nucleoside-diphosphate-sugar epimerase